MSADNSIVRSDRKADPKAERLSFALPPDVVARYEIREVQSHGGADRRVGLFLPTDRQNPAIEIAGDRITARNADPETVASLVKIAQHNGWDRIDVEGSPEFRKAVWAAASREGLHVSGYEPTVVEQEQMDERRREAAVRHEREADRPTPPAQADVADTTIAARSAEGGREAAARDQSIGGGETELSDGDRRLLLTLSRHTEDRKALYENLTENLDGFQREVQYERIGANRQALGGALDRVLESPTMVKAFERSGYEPDALRQMGQGGKWDGDFADVIYLVRSGLNRHDVAKDAGVRAVLADELDAERGDRSVVNSTAAQDRQPEREPQPAQDNRQQDGAPQRRYDSDELAEIFLHGGAERLAGEPRLAGALQAQTTMEQHIGEVFEGDASRMASANLESRQMISDVLRRGLDVSVREPTPVRQIEPIQTRPDLER